ncbi:hypothetical protein BH23CHL8_BH23CHL8_03220 [soil metagenome]
MPPLGWLFVALAVLVVWLRMDGLEFSLLYSPPLQIPGLLAYQVQALAVILLPAALLLRTADAFRTHRVLLVGLIVLAAAEVVDQTGFSVWESEPDLSGGVWEPGLAIEPGPLLQLLGWPIELGPLLQLVGWPIVGLGLARLRPGGLTRPPLLVAIAGLYVGPWLLLGVAILAGLEGGILIAPYPMTVHLLILVATASAVWVAAGAWLDRAAPRLFWGLLAAGCRST